MQLVRDAWYAVLSSRELGDRPIARRRLGLDLVFWRAGAGRVGVAEDRCPHRRVALSAGRVSGGCVECPFHGFTFDADGACRSIPAHPDRRVPRAMRLHALEAREAHGLVWIWTGPAPAPDAPIPFFAFDGASCAGSELAVPVDTHYTVGVENQLDFAHLAFVHRTTIGRFVAPGEVSVELEHEGDRLRAWRTGASGAVELLGPNIWRLDLGRSWQFLAFAPVDEGRMVYYVRSYQRAVTLPGLDWLYGRLGRVSTRFILQQDIRVVETIPRGETRLSGLGEVLVPSDAAIIAYRRWREARRAPFAPFGGDDREPSREAEGASTDPAASRS